MNNRADQESLLSEVLAEASPADFRATMLAETLRLARRRRHFRQGRRRLGVILVMGLLAAFVMQKFSKSPVVSPVSAAKILNPAYNLVSTRPLPTAALVSTRSFPATEFAAPIPTVIEIATVSGEFHSINDDDLLAMLADKPAVLIRTGPHSEELVFASPDDQKLLQPN
jgi:hypothetical protein